MSTRPLARLAALTSFCLVLLGCGSPLVGLECKRGFTRCGDACYDLTHDPAHCGTCELACGAAESCVASACMPGLPGDGGTPMDGAVMDGSVGPDGGDGAVRDDASTAVDASGPPSVPCTGAGSPTNCACDLGQLKCGLDCVDALTDHENCGECGRACAALEVCAAGTCAPRCTAPLELCGNVCIDTTQDINNCMMCGHVCDEPGAACVNSECVGNAVGHIVMIGHDMTSYRPPMRTLVGNAVFLVRSSPVRVLTYEAQTSQPSRTKIAEAIASASVNLGGRLYTLAEAAADSVSLQLSAADVFVIEPQQGASDDQLKDLGRAWSIALRSFLHHGGVVLLFDASDSSSPNLGTYQILGPDGANLMPVTGRTAGAPPNRRLDLITFGDAIAAGVPNAYVSDGLTSGFYVDPHAFIQPVQVVWDPVSGAPVVIHLAAVE